MPSAEPRAVRFVRLMLKGAVPARLEAGSWTVIWGGQRITLHAGEVAGLQAQGVLTDERGKLKRTAEAPVWVRRQLSAGIGRPSADGAGPPPSGDRPLINLDESPLARLAAATGGTGPFLEPHHVEAGERIRRLVERSQLLRRVTMSYSPARTASGGGAAAAAADVSDLAYDARKRLGECLGTLPADCAGVVLDVCGFAKGLQAIETERRWPRRSAKLVLRIGLDGLAAYFGLSSVAEGRTSRRPHAWLGEGARPDIFE